MITDLNIGMHLGVEVSECSVILRQSSPYISQIADFDSSGKEQASPIV